MAWVRLCQCARGLAELAAMYSFRARPCGSKGRPPRRYSQPVSRSLENHGLPLTLVLGGARSGKSRYAEAATMTSPPPWIYVATAEPFDDEMRARIAEHRGR